METITVNDEEWFDLSTKLQTLTLTNDEVYVLQPLDNEIYYNKSTSLPTGIKGCLIEAKKFLKFKYTTGKIIGLKVNRTTLSKTTTITVAEVE